MVEISSEAIKQTLRNHVKKIDPLGLRFNASKIRTHTIRTSFAMILSEVSVHPYIIKLIGRWSSDAWMRYIRSKLADFTKDISKQMIQASDNFYNLPKSTFKYIPTQPKRSLGPTSLKTPPTSDTADTHVFRLWR